MSKENKILLSLVGLSSILFLVLGNLVVNKTQPPVLQASGDAKAEVLGASSHDWGLIDIDGGPVEKEFTIKNVGEIPLDITNIKTSCMCTEAQFNIAGKTSPAFGMHTRSGWKGAIEPGETASISVVFDPMFHGPQGTGPITRLVSFNTNASESSYIEFKLTGDVVKK